MHEGRLRGKQHRFLYKTSPDVRLPLFTGNAQRDAQATLGGAGARVFA